MNTLVKQHSALVRRLRCEQSSVTVGEIKQFFDQLILYLREIPYRPNKTDGLDLLTIVCDDLASANTIQLFDHPILINHPVFAYINCAFNMLLTKCNHLQSISMKKNEEDALYAISYFVTQLCLHRNRAIVSFYGRISDKVFPVTENPNQRDITHDQSDRGAKDLTEKPNLKVACLQPSAPQSRPMDYSKLYFDTIPRRKKNIYQSISFTKEPVETNQSSVTTQSASHNLPIKAYQDIFLTSTFFDKLRRGIDDLSQNEYPQYHVKYKVIDRLVRLCSKMNTIDSLCDSIVKCLCSKVYQQTFATIELEQLRLTPKQLFFIYRCPQVFITIEHQQQKKLTRSLCPVMITRTAFIIDEVLSNNGN